MKAILIFLSFVLLISCKSNSTKKGNGNSNITSKIESNKYAQNFKIIKHSDFTEIQIINPDNKTVEKKYALATDISKLKLSKDIIPIQTPIKSIVSLAGTDIGILEKLACSDKIKGILSNNYIYNPTVKQNFKNNKVKEIGDLNLANPESFLGISKLITYSGFGTPPSNEGKLAKLDILCIPIYDWKENHPLGKAEWIKLFAVLFEKENLANSYFNKIEKEYNKMLELAETMNKKPSLISGSMIGDLWYMPAGESFNATFFYKAKCDYVNSKSKGTGSSAYSFEHVFKEFQHSEFWINPGFKSKKELLQANSKYAYFDAFKNDKIFCYSHNMNYFWEMSAIEPQKVLSDLIKILHLSHENSKYSKFYFYKKIN